MKNETPTNKVIRDLLIILHDKGVDIETSIVDILNQNNFSRNTKSRMRFLFRDILDLGETSFLSTIELDKELRSIKRKESERLRRENDVERLRKLKNEYQKKRRLEDNVYRMKHLMRNVVLNSFKNKRFKKGGKAEDIIGCSYEFLITHLESKFQDGMTWENRGVHGWHIDHIIPLSSANNEDELIKLNHYTNLQPLWAEDNLKKSNKFE